MSGIRTLAQRCMITGVHGDAFARTGQPHHDSLGQRVLRGDVHAAELARVVEGQHQPVTRVDLAQQHTRGPDRDDQRAVQHAAPNTLQLPASARRGWPRSPGPARPGSVRNITLGGAVGGCALRTVTVAVMLPSPKTVMFWMIPSARSAQACARFSALMSPGRYQ